LGLLERIFVWYVLTAGAIAAGFGFTAPAPQPGRTAIYLGIHAAVLAVALNLRRLARWRTPGEALLSRGLLTAVGLPIVFQSLALVLPGIHPEPFELRWIELDRAWFGVDPTVAAQRFVTPAAFELLQLCYSTFYLLPAVLVLVLLGARRIEAGERALATIAFAFLLSYAGYLIWPTLPPYRFLHHGPPLHGLLLADALHALLDGAELHRWDCFPSGHTMVTLVTLVLAWREARRLFWWLLPVGTLLIASTIALRYHYAVDVLAGAAGAVVALLLARLLLRAEAAAQTS
jgi:membrane-associated phospholipid phosphatase